MREISKVTGLPAAIQQATAQLTWKMSRVPSIVEYSPSRRGLLMATPTKPESAVRKVNSPVPPNAHTNLQTS